MCGFKVSGTLHLYPASPTSFLSSNVQLSRLADALEAVEMCKEGIGWDIPLLEMLADDGPLRDNWDGENDDEGDVPSIFILLKPRRKLQPVGKERITAFETRYVPLGEIRTRKERVGSLLVHFSNMKI